MSENVKPGQSALRSETGKRHSLGPPPPPETKSFDTRRQIQEFTNKLVQIYDVAEALQPPVLDPTDYRSLSIDCQELKLNSDGSYANPYPQPCFFNAISPNVMNHPVEFTSEMEESRDYYDSMEGMLNRCARDSSMGYSSTDLLSDTLEWEFCEYPRKGLDETLASQSNWRQSGDAVFDRDFWDELFYPNKIHYAPTVAFVPESNDKPHLMFCMRQKVEADDRLLRGEFLCIVAGIITRLGRFASAGHLYAPVLVFSFLGRLQGRILQAHYDGTHVVIRKSKIYNFSPANFRAMFNIFVQQMSNTPMGPTRGVHEAQGSPHDFSLRQKPLNIR